MSAAPQGRGFSAWLEALFFAGVVALVPAPLFATSMAYFGLLIVTVLFLISVARGGWRTLEPQPLDIPIAVFLVIRVLSTLTSVDPLGSWKGLEKSGLLLAYYPLAHMPLGAVRRRAGVYIHLVAVGYAAVVGIIAFGFGFQNRVAARAGGYTTFAEILAVAVCIILAFLAFTPGRRAWRYVAAAAVPLGAVVLTFCRGQWLALAAGVGVIGFLKDKRVLVGLAVLAVELDGFRELAATHGERLEEDVLRETVQRLRTAVRTSDWVGRNLGARFFLVLPGCNADRAIATGERVRRALFDRPVRSGEQTHTVTTSVGVAAERGGSIGAEELVARAGAALRASQEAGGNTIRLAQAKIVE